jgi:hypothetical protein
MAADWTDDGSVSWHWGSWRPILDRGNYHPVASLAQPPRVLSPPNDQDEHLDGIHASAMLHSQTEYLTIIDPATGAKRAIQRARQ